MKRKRTGGKKVSSRGRRSYEKVSYSAETLKGKEKLVKRRARASHIRVVVKLAEYANVLDSTSNITSRSKILKTIENAASRDYERRGIISKGAIIETDKGNAKVTSRPGSDGVINAILIR